MSYYIHSYLKKVLSGWIEDDFSQESIKIGLLSGHLVLSSVELARKEMGISDGLALSIDKGSIGRLEIHAPWHRIHQGYLSVSVSDLNVIVQVTVADGEQASAEGSGSNSGGGGGISHDMKMSKLAAEELAQLGTKGAESWLSAYLKGFLLAMVARFASAFTLTVSRVRVTVLLPLAAEECLAMELNMDSLSISQPRSSASGLSSMFSALRPLIRKQLVCKNISMHMDTVSKPANQRDVMALWERPQYSFPLVVSVYDCSVSVQLAKDSWAASSDGIYGWSDLSVDFKCLNIELSCAIHQLLLMRECVNFISLEQRRLRLRSIRRIFLCDTVSQAKSQPQTSGQGKEQEVAEPVPFDAKLHWQYVLKAVLFVVKEEKRVLAGNTLRSAVAKLALRRSYIGLHQKRMNNAFRMAGLPQGWAGPEDALSEDDERRIAELEQVLSLDDLVAFRSFVNKDLINRGVHVALLKEMIAGKGISKQWTSAALNAMGDALQVEELPGNIATKLSLTISRVGMSVFHSGSGMHREQHAPGDSSRVISVILHGIAANWDNGARLFDAFIGGVNIYGIDNSSLVTFGKVTDIPSFEVFRSQCFQGNPDLAVSLSSQHHTIVQDEQHSDKKRFQYESFTATDYHGNVNHYFIQPSKEHVVIEAKFSNLTLSWSQLCVGKLLSALKLLHHTGDISSTNPFADEKLRLAKLSVYNAAGGTIVDKQKLSLSIVCKAIKIEFPLQKDRDIGEKHLEVGFEDMQFSAGDHLDTLLSENSRALAEESSSEKMGHQEAEDDQINVDSLTKMLQTVQTLRNPLIHPVVFLVRGVFIRYADCKKMSDHSQPTDRQLGSILRTPWLIDGALSVCNLYSHPDFTDLRVDLHLGPLEIQLQTRDVIHVAEITSSIVQTLISDAPRETPGKYLIAPKVKRLEGLSVAYLSIHLDKLKLTSIEEMAAPAAQQAYLAAIEEHIMHSLEYHSHLAFDHHVDASFKRILSQQLHNFGFPERNVASVVEQCIDCLDQPLPAHETLAERIVINLRASIKDGELANLSIDWAANYPKIQFQIEMTGLDILHHRFVYNSDLSLKLKSLAFFDADHVSLLAIRSESCEGIKGRGGSVPTKSKGVERRMSALFPRAVQDILDNQSREELSSLSLAMSSRQVNEGTAVSDLYVCHYREREQEWRSDLQVDCADINIYFNTSRLVSICNYMIDLAASIAVQLKQRHEERMRAFPSSTSQQTLSSNDGLGEQSSVLESQSSCVTTDSFNISVNGISVLVACDNRLFSSVRLAGVQFRHINAASHGLNISVSLTNLEVLDLTPAGRLYRQIVWKKNPIDNKADKPRSSLLPPPQSPPMVVVEIYEERNVIRIVPRVDGLRLTFLFRFVSEFIVVIADHIVVPINRLVAHAAELSQQTHSNSRSTPPPSPSSKQTVHVAAAPIVIDEPVSPVAEPGKSLEIVISLKDVHGLVPRNSFSEDIIGLVIETASVNISSTDASWPVPSKEEIERTMSYKTPWERPLYFNPNTNAWEESAYSVEEELRRHWTVDNDDDLFFDTAPDSQESESWKPMTSNEVMRIAVEAFDIGIHLSLLPTPNSSSQPPETIRNKGSHLQQHSEYAEIIDGKDVLNHPVHSGLRSWMLVSRSKLNLQVIVDLTATMTRLLFSDCARFSKLDLAVSQAELYLLMGLWFDNVHELPRFPSEPPLVKVSVDDEDAFSPPAFPFNEYGNEDYLRYFMEIHPTFELAVVRAEVCLACAMDINYFPIPGPNAMYLQNSIDLDRNVLAASHERFRNYLFSTSNSPDPRTSRGDARRNSLRLSTVGGHRRVTPVADLRVVGLVLFVTADMDVTQLSVSASLCEVYDIRQGSNIPVPLILRLASLDDPTNSQHLKQGETPTPSRAGHYSYGYADGKYGFDNTSEDTDTALDLPLKFSMLLVTPSNWLTMNLGLDMADMNLHCLDICLLLADYFSCYFRFKEFTHPGLAAYDRLDTALIPYGGNDFRFFIMRPHISIVDAAVAVNPSGLFIEAERGIFFRYVLDTNGSNRMELNMHDLAVVLVKQYRPPSISRGVRGSSGSGRGVRTMIEYLNAAFTYKFAALENQLDIEFEIFTPDDEEETNAERSSFVDLNGHCGGIGSLFIAEPTCLLPIVSSKKDFTPYSSNVVTSYEDIMFCKRAVDQLLSLNKVKSEPTPATAPPPALANAYYSVSVTGIRLLLVDNVLGLHLPLFQGYCDSVRLVFDRSNDVIRMHSFDRYDPRRNESMLPGDRLRRHSFVLSPETTRPDSFQVRAADMNKQDERLFATTVFWIDYFNNLKKCWEPFVEKLCISAQYEKSRERGVGCIVRSSSAAQIYLSGALIRTLFDTMRTFQINDPSNTQITVLPSKNTDIAPDWYDDLSVDKKKNSLDTRLVSFSIGGADPSQKTGGLKGGRRRSSIMVGNPHLLVNSALDRIDHIPSLSLQPSLRVGFSIFNLTGQPIRYLQQWEGGKRTVQYLNNNERGLLNIVAAQTLIRNGRIVEETFEVQQEQMASMRARNHKKLVGNRVALQVSGYRWLHSVQADELGVQNEELFPILGRVDATRVFRDERIAYSLKLMVEVLPYCGGRMLRLRSVFSVKNYTKHKLQILARKGTKECEDSTEASPSPDEEESRNAPFFLSADEELYLPIALLYQSIIDSQGRSLGLLFIKPADLKPIEEELESRLGVSPGRIEYSTDPINLFQLAGKAGEKHENGNSDVINEWQTAELDSSRTMQLCCHVNPKQKVRHGRRFGGKNKANMGEQSTEVDKDVFNSGQAFSSSKLPPFCYSVEIIRDAQSFKKTKETSGAPHLRVPNPRSFTIAVYPPIMIENLLPTYGVFELLHAEQKRVLWSSCIAPGAVKAVHTVTLEEPLLLVINLRYCRASEGVLIHRPNAESAQKRSLATKLQRAIEGLLDEAEQDDISSIILTDTVGQRLRINVENTQGAGRQRHIVVYCPYWIMNTSQYAFRIREEGEMELTAGSVTPQKDGTRPVPLSNSSFPDKTPVHEIFDPNRTVNPNRSSLDAALPTSPSKAVRNRHATEEHVDSSKAEGDFKVSVFPGCCGSLHQLVRKELNLSSPLCDLFRELGIADVMRMSYMFNYRDSSSVLSNGKKVKLQLDDTEWSRPFSLESVGVNQVLSVDHPARGLLEVGMKISVAPGRLSKYTKIIRFQPRFAMVNRLDCPLKVLQASGIAGEMAEVDVSPNHIRAYHLPALFGERKVSLLIDGPWQRTVFFNVDQIGAFTLEAKRNIDLASIPHVNTRGAPEYTEFLPTSKVIGIAFETDWGEENIVVKGIQIGSYAARETDIRVGDVLLAVNDESVNGSKFEHAMALLKARIADQGCNIKLRTVEEKMRIIRVSAFQTAQKASNERRRSHSIFQTAPAANRSIASPAPTRETDGSLLDSTMTHRHEDEHRDVLPLRVELRLIESTVMVLVNELSDQFSTEYRIENKSICYRIHYKQKGIPGSSWSTLNPGQSCAYIWQDPFKPHKLLVHVGDNILCPSDQRNSTTLSEGGELGERGKGDDSLGKYLGYLAGVSNENATVISMDEIGSKENLPLRRADGKLLATIKSEGPTKVLLIAPSLERTELLKEMRYCTTFLREQVALYSDLESKLLVLLDATQGDSNRRVGSLMFRVDDIMRMLLTNIVECQQKMVSHSVRTIIQRVDSATEDDGGDLGVTVESALSCYKSFERVLEGGIDKPHQLIVEVLEACDLPPLVRGKSEDIYCKMYVRNYEENFIDKARSPANYTFVCDQTLDPKWLQQKFVFDVDPSSETDYRNFNLRILVKAKSVTGIDNVIARLDVPFSCLREEDVVEGWFPLRPSRSSVLLYKASGSIKLRLQWVHSDVGFASYALLQTERRLRELKLQLDVQKHFRRAVEKLAKAKGSSKNNIIDSDATDFNQKDYYSMVEKVAKMQLPTRASRTRKAVADGKAATDLYSTPQRRRTVSADTDEPSSTTIRLFPAIVDPSERALLSPVAEEKEEERGPNRLLHREHGQHTPFVATKSQEHALSQMFASCEDTSNCVMHHCDSNMNKWLRSTRPLRALHDQLSSFMSRPAGIEEQNFSFRQQFDREGSRSYIHAFTQTGTLEIAPIQALHLPVSNNYVHVKISYGNEKYSTFSVPPAAFTTWHQETSVESNITASLDEGDDTQAGSREGMDGIPLSLSKSFEIDLLNIKGNVQVRVMSESFPKSQEIARIEVPVFGMVDCTCTLTGGGYYDRWFPLILADNLSAEDTAQDTLAQLSQSEEASYAKFGYHPCIRLRMRWIPTHGTRVEDPQFYGRVQIPSVSVSFVDSEHARAVMQATISSLEVRRAVTKAYTDVSINVTGIQVDNQLPDPVSNVILSPKIVKAPQPVIRLHFRKKNLLSQHNLECFQTIQLVVQELDLRLEQQTVLASWALVKNWLHEAKSGDDKDTSQSSDEGPLNRGSQGIFNSGDTKVMSPMLVNKRGRSSSIPDNDVTALLYDDDTVKLYIEDFRIFPIKINVSFLITPPHIVQVYRKQLKRLDVQAEGTYSSSMSLFLWQVGEVVLDLTSSISDAPIFFNGFEAPHLFKTSADVTRILQDHYLHSALGQLYKIVGSLDVVGNPIALLSSLSVGVRDFFYEPAHALITSPTAFGKIGKGVVKGTVSLVSNTTVGFLGTGTTITRSIGRGFAKLSMDSSYIKAREKLQKTPGTIKGTMLRPAKDVAVGLVYSVTGLVKVPYSSVKAYGLRGLAPGIVKGVAGLVVDPAVGILDAVTHSGDACKEILKNLNKGKVEEAKRVRLSDLFGPDGRLLPYSFQIALGTQILGAFGRYNEQKAMHRGSLLWSGGRDMIAVGSRPQQQKSLPRKDSTVSEGDASLIAPAPTRRSSMVVRKNRFSFKSLDSDTSLLMDTSSNEGNDRLQSLSRHAMTQMEADKPNAAQEVLGSEFVVHTSLLGSSSGEEVVAILTTLRIIIAEYSRSAYGSYVNKRWECPLSQLAAPSLERGGGSSSATLALRTLDHSLGGADRDRLERSKSKSKGLGLGGLWGPRGGTGSAEASSHHLVASYQEEDVLVNLYNCLHALLGHFVPLIATTSGVADACVEDEYGVRHIGPWQFAAKKRGGAEEEDGGDSSGEAKRALIRELELERWVYPHTTTSSGAQQRCLPAWLGREEDSAMACHAAVRDLYSRCKAMEREILHPPGGARPKNYLRIPIESLFKGNITAEEFEAAVQSPHPLDQQAEADYEGMGMGRGPPAGAQGTQGGWRDFLRLGQSPSKIEQRFFSLFSDQSMLSAAAASAAPEEVQELTAPSPPITPEEVQPKERQAAVAHPAGRRSRPLSLSGLFPKEPDSPSGNTPEEVMPFSWASTPSVVQHTHTPLADIVQKRRPFSFSTPEEVQDEQEEVEKEEVREEDEVVGEGEAAFTYSDLKPRTSEEVKEEEEESSGRALPQVCGENPLRQRSTSNTSFMSRPRAGSSTAEEVPPAGAKRWSKEVEMRRWSSPAVLPRLVTPPRRAALLTPAPSTSTPLSPPPPPAPSPAVTTEEVLGRLDRLELLLRDVLRGVGSPMAPEPPTAATADADNEDGDEEEEHEEEEEEEKEEEEEEEEPTPEKDRRTPEEVEVEVGLEDLYPADRL